jgi:hypothetical protein
MSHAKNIHCDIAYGMSEEERLKPVVEEFFNDTLTKTEKKAAMDWTSSSGCYYELKSRRGKPNKPIYSYSFYTTIVPLSKIDWLTDQTDIRAVFVFKFEDGVFYIEYDRNSFANFDIQKIYCADRWGDPNRDHVCIPVYLLKKMENKLPSFAEEFIGHGC